MKIALTITDDNGNTIASEAFMEVDNLGGVLLMKSDHKTLANALDAIAPAVADMMGDSESARRIMTRQIDLCRYIGDAFTKRHESLMFDSMIRSQSAEERNKISTYYKKQIDEANAQAEAERQASA